METILKQKDSLRGSQVKKFEPFQEKFLYSVKRYPAFIAGWGTGKTLTALSRACALTDNIPNNLGLIVRKEFVDLRDSTIKDFMQYTGRSLDTNKEVVCPNGSVIMFRHGDELNNLKNINLGWFMIEQAEEFATDDQFQFLRGRTRRANVPFHTGFVIGNTNGHNWIWRLWKNNPSAGYPLAEATTFDNAHNLPKDFIEDLKSMEKESPHHYARYVMNSWEDFEEADTLVPYEYIQTALDRGFVPNTDPAGSVMACDVARFGDSETVITKLDRCGENYWKQTYQEAYSHKDLMHTVGKIMHLYKQLNPDYVVIDDVGVGGGVSDRLKEQGIPVTRFIGGAKAIRDGFLNKRTEEYWKLRELLREGRIELINNEKLLTQLSTIKYYFKSNGKKGIESKDEIRKRGVVSPDRADALMMAITVISLVPEPKKQPTEAEIFWDGVRADMARIKADKDLDNEEAERLL